MAEGRMLKKRISKSQKFAALKNDKTRVLYLLLLPHVDAEGRFEADLNIIRGSVCPFIESLTTKSIAICLCKLHEAGLIILYENGNEKYLQVQRFHDFNKINPNKEALSVIPAPTPDQLLSSSGVTPAEVKLSKVKVKSSKEFISPTLEQVTDYIKEKNYSVDPKKFFDFFTESKWIDSRGNKVLNWKQKIITWSRNNGRNSGKTKQPDSRDFEEQKSKYGQVIQNL